MQHHLKNCTVFWARVNFMHGWYSEFLESDFTFRTYIFRGINADKIANKVCLYRVSCLAKGEFNQFNASNNAIFTKHQSLYQGSLRLNASFQCVRASAFLISGVCLTIITIYLAPAGGESASFHLLRKFVSFLGFLVSYAERLNVL